MDSDLWQHVKQATARARQSGALETVATEHVYIRNDDVTFIVRIAQPKALQEKDVSSKQAAHNPRQNTPFLPPYDADLFVAELSPTHVCLLNKYNVFDHHILIVTRAFEAQEAWLTPGDFAALWTCLQTIDGLAFYNGGPIAGASQPHKHLQLVPYPLAPDGPPLPIAPYLARIRQPRSTATIPAFSFRHAVASLDLSPTMTPQDAGQHLYHTYCQLLQAVDLIPQSHLPGVLQSAPYSLLATRQWMWLVPRTTHKFRGIQINSLGYAGAFLVRDRTLVELLREHAPLQALAAVSMPSSG